LAHVVAHPKAYESWQEDLTVFDSTGWALGDQVAMSMLMRHAKALGVGTEMILEDIGDDPLDPYRLGRPRSRPAADARGSGTESVSLLGER
jgi:hypothetical protein